MCEKCPNTELILVPIQENTDQKQPRIWALFTQWNWSERFSDEDFIKDCLTKDYLKFEVFRKNMCRV